MAILPQDQRQQMMLLVIILAIAAAALYYNYVHRPAGSDLLDLSDRIEDLATQNQIAETRVGNLQEWQMEVEGDFHSFGEFLTRVASFDRIVRPQVVGVVPTEQTPSGRQLVSATFNLETFVLAPDRPVAVPEEGDE